MPRIWAIGDLHLSFARPKPMDIFGDLWRDHPAKIQRACEAVVAPDDLLLIPGDISWALKSADAEADLAWVAALPGVKVLIKGNHDFWWDSDKPLRFPGLHDTPFVSEDGQLGVAGTRGWEEAGQPNDAKTIGREVQRLEKRLAAIAHCPRRIVMTHYPPLPAFLPLLRAYEIDTVVYGHVHLNGADAPLPEEWHGLRALCVAADRVNFRPRLMEVIATI